MLFERACAQAGSFAQFKALWLELSFNRIHFSESDSGANEASRGRNESTYQFYQTVYGAFRISFEQQHVEPAARAVSSRALLYCLYTTFMTSRDRVKIEIDPETFQILASVPSSIFD